MLFNLETQKLLNKRRITKDNRASKIQDILESICEANRFVAYEYSPPKSVKACKLLLERHEDEIETSLIKEQKDLSDYVCNTLSGACKGIDTKEEKKPSNHADIDLKENASVQIDPASGKMIQKGILDQGTSSFLIRQSLLKNPGAAKEGWRMCELDP